MGLDSGSQRQAGESWSTKFGLTCDLDQSQGSEGSMEKRLLWIRAWFPPSYGPRLAGSIQWLCEKKALDLPDHCTTSCHVHSQILLIILDRVTMVMNSWNRQANKQASTGLHYLLILPELCNPVPSSQARGASHTLAAQPTLWFTLMASGKTGVCLCREAEH